MTFTVEPYSSQAFELGEGPHWHSGNKKLYFVDLTGGTASTIDANKHLETLFKDTSIVSAVFPIEEDEKHLAVSVDTSLYLVNLENGEKKLIDKLSVQGVRFNDGKCDPRGRLFLGTMALENSPGELEPEKGSLYVLSNENKFVEVLPKVSLSNGLAWSHDETKFYYIDSFKRLIYVFDYNVATGEISNQKVLTNLGTDSYFKAEELPDGMTIDVKGNLWVAMFRGKRVVNIDANTGKAIQSIDLPTSLITSVSFGGDKLNELYVTSCSKFLDDSTKAKEPLAGYIFKVTSKDVNFRGYKPHFNFKL